MGGGFREEGMDMGWRKMARGELGGGDYLEGKGGMRIHEEEEEEEESRGHE